MSEVKPGEAAEVEESGRRARRGPPMWGVFLFLGLLAGMVVLNHVVSRSGPAIEWVENDLEAALRQAEAENQRVFLYMYETGDPVASRNETAVFAQRWAREPLSLVVCCRIAVDQGDQRRMKLKYRYMGKPLFLMLDQSGKEVGGSRIEGAVDERRFRTYIGETAKRPM